MAALRILLAVVFVALAVVLFAAPQLSERLDHPQWLPKALCAESGWPRVMWVVLALAAARILGGSVPHRRPTWLLLLALLALSTLALTPGEAKHAPGVATSRAILGALFASGAALLLPGLLRVDPARLRETLVTGQTASRLRAVEDATTLLRVQVQPALEALEAIAARAVRDPEPPVAAAAQALRAALGSTASTPPAPAVPEPTRAPEETRPSPQAASADPDPLPDTAGDWEEDDEDDESTPLDVPDQEAEDPAPAPPSAREVVARCLATLRRGEPRACDAAVEQLVALGAPAISPIREALASAGPDVRVDLMRALRQLED